jgi:phage terminase small subunit
MVEIMARPRTPTQVLRIRGVEKNHPERLRLRDHEPENINPVGDPPYNLSKPERAIWMRIVEESISGVLGQADRIAVELACKLYVRIDGGTATGVDYNQLIKLLSQFGMTPADRSKLSIPKPDEDSEWDF